MNQTANELSGKHSGCLWVGSEFEYNGVNCTFSIPYAVIRNVSFEKRVDIVMTWLTHKTTPANLVMLYLPEPDQAAHNHGPDSKEVSVPQYGFSFNFDFSEML